MSLPSSRVSNTCLISGTYTPNSWRQRALSNQRSGHNTIDSGDQPSRSSTTLATRPAGVYQAPEIQERNSSQAGRGSDVWSIGCVALMIMAFVCGDPSEISKLTNCLPVDFLGGGGCQNLFYVRNDSRPWKKNDVSHYTFEYLDNFSLDVGPIPNTQFEAAVNPRVIEWSNGLVDSYENQPEHDCIVQWFEVIFTSVFLISHRNRISAASLRDKLSEVQRNWRSHAVEASTNAEPRVTPPAPRANIPGPPQRELIREQEIVQPIVKRKILPHAINSVQDRSTAEPESRSALPQHVRDIESHRHNSHESREIVPRKTLGTVIKENDADAVRVELDKDPGQLNHPCSGPNVLPLYWAISNKAYLTLDALLQRCDPSITDQVCRGCTALQLACTNLGNTKALKTDVEEPREVQPSARGLQGEEEVAGCRSSKGARRSL